MNTNEQHIADEFATQMLDIMSDYLEGSLADLTEDELKPMLAADGEITDAGWERLNHWLDVCHEQVLHLDTYYSQTNGRGHLDDTWGAMIGILDEFGYDYLVEESEYLRDPSLSPLERTNYLVNLTAQATASNYFMQVDRYNAIEKAIENL